MEFTRDYDVLVVGAGVAGVAAAVEAGRSGLRVALLEKTVLTGGLATTGLINIYLPLCDGEGCQVTFGLAEELLHLSLRYGPGQVPAGWPEGPRSARKQRYMTVFSPASFTLALDELLLEARVSVWLDTLVCQALVRDGRIGGVEVENKSGRGLLTARCVVDATGDADVAYRAGVPCVQGDNWVTLWALQASAEAAGRTCAGERGRFGTSPLLDGVRLGGDARGRGAPADRRTTSGTDGREVTRFVLEGRRLLREHYAGLYRQGEDNRQTLFPVTLPAMAQFRTTRQIVGRETLSDGQHGRHVSSSIGMSADWRKAGYVWEIPYGALVPEGVSALLAAGRCISSTGDAWEVTRVIPSAALTGQVAGLAACLAVAQETTPDLLAVADVQGRLSEAGIPLHLSDLSLDR